MSKIIIDKSLFTAKVGFDNKTYYKGEDGLIYHSKNTSILVNDNLQISSELVTTPSDIMKVIQMFGAENYTLELLPNNEVKAPEPEPEVKKLTRADVILKLEYKDYNFKGLDLSNLDLSELKFWSCRFDGANLLLTNFAKCVFNGVHFDLINGYRTNFYDCKFYNCIFYRADLNECSLRDSKLDNVSFRGANFDECDVTGAEMVNVTLVDTQLTGIRTEQEYVRE